jgi:glutamate formiminotransferase
MNLTDLGKTSIPVALEAVRSAAARRGAAVESTELVGLAPLEAILQTARYYLSLRELGAAHILEMRLRDEPDS